MDDDNDAPRIAAADADEREIGIAAWLVFDDASVPVFDHAATSASPESVTIPCAAMTARFITRKA